jgi:hypothetical protein
MALLQYPLQHSADEYADYFGDGSLGNVTISTTVTLTADAHYATLTVANGGVLVANGWFIRATVAVIVDAGGVIHADGQAGYDGVNSGSGIGIGAGGGQGGGIVAIYAPSLVNNGTIRANGGDGGDHNYGGSVVGTTGQGGGTVDNGGGGGGAGGWLYAAYGNAALRSGGIGRTNGGGGVIMSQTGTFPYCAGGGPGGDGGVCLDTLDPVAVASCSGGPGVGGPPGPSILGRVVYLAGGSGGVGYNNSPGGVTWGRWHALPYQASMMRGQSFRGINVPMVPKGRIGAKPFLFGGGGGGGGYTYNSSPGGGGGGGLILTVTKTRGGVGAYQVNGGSRGTSNAWSEPNFWPLIGPGDTGNIFHFTWRD